MVSIGFGSLLIFGDESGEIEVAFSSSSCFSLCAGNSFLSLFSSEGMVFSEGSFVGYGFLAMSHNFARCFHKASYSWLKAVYLL